MKPAELHETLNETKQQLDGMMQAFHPGTLEADLLELTARQVYMVSSKDNQDHVSETNMLHWLSVARSSFYFIRIHCLI